jgi:hypothetical protein
VYAPASASVAFVKAKRGTGASRSDMIGQNGMQLKIPLRMVVRVILCSAVRKELEIVSIEAHLSSVI